MFPVIGGTEVDDVINGKRGQVVIATLQRYPAVDLIQAYQLLRTAKDVQEVSFSAVTCT